MDNDPCERADPGMQVYSFFKGVKQNDACVRTPSMDSLHSEIVSTGIYALTQ